MDNRGFANKAEALRPVLHHHRQEPVTEVDFVSDSAAFQGLRVQCLRDAVLPITLNAGDTILLDFGDHHVGYLHYTLSHLHRITDTPIKLEFTFGEFPLEITTPPEMYQGSLGCGWLQNEIHSTVFTPKTTVLERRYAFRYLRIRRLDNAVFPVALTELFVDAVSAVRLEDAPALALPDARLQAICDMSMKTLKECEQEVFEDGPKRDRRLWIGDLRLQALTDYTVFRNLPLIKRCIYLFAAYPAEDGHVVPCVFPDSAPYRDQWYFSDYSLYFASLLYDYCRNTGDAELVRELYPVAARQVELVGKELQANPEAHTTFFIDWCRELDKSVAALGVFGYVLKQFIFLTELLGLDAAPHKAQLEQTYAAIRDCYSAQDGLFVTKQGQCSFHSQVWAILSGAVAPEAGLAILHRIREREDAVIMHTPYMIHYYIEALFACGAEDEGMAYIRDIWGQIADTGLDCCPEIFNPRNQLESPYNAPEINSACHAWSCTPVYWIRKVFGEQQ